MRGSACFYFSVSNFLSKIPAKMTRPIPKFLSAFAILVALLLIAAFIFNSTRPALLPPPLPNPNGYDDFIAAGKLVSGGFSDYNTRSEQELKEFVLRNSEA